MSKNAKTEVKTDKVIKVGKGVSAEVKRFIAGSEPKTKTVYLPSNIRIERKDDYVKFLQYTLAESDKKHLTNSLKALQSRINKISDAITTAADNGDTETTNTLTTELSKFQRLEKSIFTTLKECEEFISTIETAAKTMESTLSTYDLQFFTDLMIATKNKRLNYKTIEKPLQELIDKLTSGDTIPEDYENTDYKEVKAILKKATSIINGHAITGDFFTAFTPKITAKDMQSILKHQYSDIAASRNFTYAYVNDTKKQLATKIYAIAFKDILIDRDELKKSN